MYAVRDAATIVPCGTAEPRGADGELRVLVREGGAVIARPRQPGEWDPPEDVAFIIYRDGEPQLMIKCPDCGVVTTTNHDVLLEGDVPTVSPSIVCPTEGCSFHKWLRAGRWER